MSSFILKAIAVISMLIDHIGFTFFPGTSLFRIIGRIALPIFAFQVALGFEHTKNRNKYMMRMLLFAIISQIPFRLFVSIYDGPDIKLNIGFTFLLALLILYSLENIKPIWGKILCVIPVLIISCILSYDYYLYGVFLVVIFYYTYKKPYLMIPLVFIITSAYTIYRNNILQLYSLISLIPILFYNGQKGKSYKYYFYAFYPIHLMAIYLIFKFCL